MATRPTLHLIGNSHLDPVWLWDWREGLTEGIATCRTVLQLMEEFPEMTYIRGESAIYAHIEKYAPEVFEGIREQIGADRWEVVGGGYLQPDTNLPATEVLCRHFTSGLRYFQNTLKRRPRVAWAADSFGHSAGLPEIFSAAGFEYFAFSRPSARDLTLPGPAFWWEAASGKRILCWRLPVAWYGNERGDMFRRLDESLAHAREQGLTDIAVFYGLGNHGGGPCRQHLHDIRRWTERTPEARVVHSSLQRFFDTLASREAALPIFRGELNFTLRGCYSSATRFKAAYRRAEAQLLSVERTSTAAALLTKAKAPSLGRAWESILFNTFHDVLPGTSIERAMDQQFEWVGAAAHEARAAELDALHQIGNCIDTRPPAPAENMPAAVPVLLWNSHAHPFTGQVEFEACLDHRPIFAYENRPAELPVQLLTGEGEPLAFQCVETEHNFMPALPWRKRVVTSVTIPPFGWRLLHFSWTEKPLLAPAPSPSAAPRATGSGGVQNEFYRIEAAPGSRGVHIHRRGRPLFGEHGMGVVSFDDPWGSWGGHEGEPEAKDISQDPCHWSIGQVSVLETGPLRAVLWVEFIHGASRVALTLRLENGQEAVHVQGRLFWAERGRRLKLVLPVEGQATFDVPGGAIQRDACGEVPGGRWVRAGTAENGWVLATDSIYNYDQKDGVLRATVVRSTRYAWNPTDAPSEQPWRPYADLGEHRFALSLAPHSTNPDHLANALETPPVAWVSPAHAGTPSPTGSIASLAAPWRLLALKPADCGEGFILRAQNASGLPAHGEFTCLHRKVSLGALAPWEIGTWLLDGRALARAQRTDVSELPVPAKTAVVEAACLEAAAL